MQQREMCCRGKAETWPLQLHIWSKKVLLSLGVLLVVGCGYVGCRLPQKACLLLGLLATSWLA